MIVAHEQNCPALCQLKTFVGHYEACKGGVHESHACACRAAEKLRELVEAADWALSEIRAADEIDGRDYGFDPKTLKNYNTNADELEVALKPFRPAPETGREESE